MTQNLVGSGGNYSVGYIDFIRLFIEYFEMYWNVFMSESGRRTVGPIIE